MKLYIKQKVFSLGDKYHVYDEEGEMIYQVIGKIFSIGAQITLFDRQDQALYLIKQKITFLLKYYEIYRDENMIAAIQQEFALFKPKLTIESEYGSFDVQGDFFGMDFELFHNGQVFGTVKKKWLSWGDTYELDITDGTDAAFFAAIVIAIDNCIHNESQNNNNN